ncbi:hypothetical protein HDV57DRAFT_214263 [Trichoderma longibrachiatum]
MIVDGIVVVGVVSLSTRAATSVTFPCLGIEPPVIEIMIRHCTLMVPAYLTPTVCFVLHQSLSMSSLRSNSIVKFHECCKKPSTTTFSLL